MKLICMFTDITVCVTDLFLVRICLAVWASVEQVQIVEYGDLDEERLLPFA